MPSYVLKRKIATNPRSYILKRKVSEKVVNATVLGFPTITSDFIVWGFSTSNYLQLYNTFNPGSSTWEVFLHFKTGSIGTTQELLSRADNDYYGLKIGILPEGKFWYTLDNNKTSHLFEQHGVTTVTANTEYWLKLSFDGSAYTALISTDNQNWTTDKTFTSSATIIDTTAGTYLGINKTIDRVFTGAFFLHDCYIKVNNSTWWNGTRMAIVEKSYNLWRIMQRTVPNCVNVGATIDSNFIASGFNASNYLDVPQALPAINNYIQVYIKCTVGNLALGQNGRNTIFATKAVIKPSFGVANTGQPAIYLSGWGLGPSVYSAGQTIWLRVGWDKSTYVLYSCLDQGYTLDDIATMPWVQEGAWGDTTNIFSNAGFILGRNIYTPGEYWGGSLDLKNTRVDVDGKIIYLGTKEEKY